jgi:hypothetical protein
MWLSGYYINMIEAASGATGSLRKPNEAYIGSLWKPCRHMKP